MSAKAIGRVGVLTGGTSSEREISLRSGRAVHAGLLREGIDAVLLDVKNDIDDMLKRSKIDLAFIALHGRFGEDGTVQKILEDMEIPYTGSGPTASKHALDKTLAKAAFEHFEIPTPQYVIFEKDDFDIENCYGLGFPIVVKPHLEGSSIGLSVVYDKYALPEAIDIAHKYSDLAVIEEYISGRELTVGILDDEPLPVIEIVTRDNIYDYKAKYEDPETRYLVSATLDDRTVKKAQALAKSAHMALGCRCFSRIDMIMNSSLDMFVLEVNTIPGMTERSLLPKAAQAIGLSFEKLCIKMIEDALAR